jgi:Thioredoxin-related protein
MKTTRAIVCVFTVLAAVSLAPALMPAGAASAGRVNWYDYREAQTLAKEEGKKVYLYFRSERCTYCRQMEQETLNAPEVARFLNQNFVSARIDSDRRPKIAAKYRVVGLPTSYFLSNDGRRIGGIPGFQQPDRFLDFKGFLHSESYRKMSFGDF